MDGHSAQFLPYDSQLQLIFIKAFTDTQKKIVHHKMEEDDIDVSCSLTGWHQHQTEILCQHYAKDRWTNEATIMYSVTDQQKTNEFESQMKKNQVKNITPKIIGQMEQHNVHNVQCYRSTQSYISPLSKMKKIKAKRKTISINQLHTEVTYGNFK